MEWCLTVWTSDALMLHTSTYEQGFSNCSRQRLLQAWEAAEWEERERALCEQDEACLDHLRADLIAQSNQACPGDRQNCC